MGTICIITPITTQGFRDVSQVSAFAPAGTTLSCVTLERGPASVESALDEVLAGPGVVDAALKAQADGCDAIVIDCMLDPALEAVREAVTIPVVGCGQAGLETAAQFGAFSVVTVLQRQERAFVRLANSYGLSDRLASVLGIGVNVLDLDKARQTAITATVAACAKARKRDEASAVVFGCTGMLGYGEEVAQALGWKPERVIDPLVNAIGVAARAISANARTDKNEYPFPEKKQVIGFEDWPNLEQSFDSIRNEDPDQFQ